MDTFAQRVEALRTEKKQSRSELAAAIGLPRTSIEKIETGRLTPNRDQQEKLASYFGVSILYLKGETDDRTSMTSWLSGNFQDDSEAVAPAPVRKTVERKVVAQADTSSGSSGAMFGALLRSDDFRAAVIEVLRTPEGEKLLRQIIRKEMNR